ncbi:hypothetical protein BDV33DRAFT_50488 [Aspergillus novoparasiticus]|uniref:Uncharacterized protein n=1 Tax=Aspergillus novoparasiticus TaxID=986946 RepID=A0A5N6F030_9EURO|nr:hypothetical protein BDV33DRAFT_50488 [Aspergillus novoparasiticus]
MENPEPTDGITRGKAKPGLGPNHGLVHIESLYGRGGEWSDESHQLGHDDDAGEERESMTTFHILV